MGEVNYRFNKANITKALAIESINVNGFVIIEDWVDSDLVDKIEKEFRNKLLKDLPYERNSFAGLKTKRVYNIFQKTRNFDKLATDPFILDIMETIMNENGTSCLSSTVGIEIHPFEQPQMVHTDDGKYPVKALDNNELVMNSMYAFDYFTDKNGSTLLWPGSHFWPDKHSLDNNTLRNERHHIKAIMPKGSIMLYRGSILHGGGMNETENPRLGVILEYIAGYLKPQENHALGVDIDTLLSLPNRLIELLGLNIYPPFVGMIDGRSPARYLREKYNKKSSTNDDNRIDMEKRLLEKIDKVKFNTNIKSSL